FDQCKFLFINIPINEIDSFDEIESVDEAAEKLDRSLEFRGGRQVDIIPPEVEFWGHCSNLQVWVENNYDSRLLHRNLAFPLLERLAEVGDPTARKVFKEEIAIRMESGFPSVVEYLVIQGYLDYLNEDEFDAVVRNPKVIDGLINACYKDGEGLYQFDGLYELLKKVKKVDEKYFKEIIKKLLMKNDFKLNNFFDRTDFMYELSKSELVFTLLESKEAEAVLKLDQLIPLGLDFSIEPNRKEASVFVESKHMTELSLSYCHLETFPQDILKFKKLQELSLDRNQLFELPESISKLKELKHISLNRNNFTSFPKELCNMPSLITINLSDNKINQLPECIKNLKSLKYLIVRNNKIQTVSKLIKNKKDLILEY
ncbi:hypothetical protein LCGC14_2328210, partial [marine sediment metagenome]